jgi:hypothetical protein
MPKYNSGHLIADGSAINIDIGFVPDHFHAKAKIEEGTWVAYDWYRELANTGTANGQYGLTDTAGTKSANASAAAGFASYDTVTFMVLLPAPNGSGEQGASYPNTWTTGRSTAATARSSTALGTVIKPTAGNETGYIYECTTAGTGGATEPTWPTIPGNTVTDGTTVWTCRDEKVKNIGAKGITIGATLSTDTDEWVWEAWAADSVAAERDAAVYDPVGKYPNS